MKQLVLPSTLVLLAFIFIAALPFDALYTGFGLSDSGVQSLGELTQNTLAVVISLWVIFKQNLAQLAGLNFKSKWLEKHLVLVPVYLIIIGVLQLINKDFTQVSTTDIGLLFIATLSIGFAEEFVFRGLLQSLFLKTLGPNASKSDLMKCVLIPSLLFGLLHLLNFNPANAASEIAQFLYSVFIGTAFGAILLRTNKLIPLAIIHGLIDFVFQLEDLLGKTTVSLETDSTQELINATASLLVVAPLFVVGLLLLRKMDIKHITQS